MTRRSILFFVLGFSWKSLGESTRNESTDTSRQTVSIELDGGSIAISYNRAHLGTKQLVSDVAPYGKLWPVGGGTPAEITVNAYTITPFFELLPGSYSLYAIPYPAKWTIVVSHATGRSAASYDPSQDLGRFDLPVTKLGSRVEKFTIALTRKAPNVARMQFEWDRISLGTTLAIT